MTTAPTRSELAHRLRTFEGRFKRVAILTLALWAAAFASAVGVVMRTAETRYAWIAGWAFGAALLLVFVGAVYIDRRRAEIAREVGIACGTCNKPVATECEAGAHDRPVC